jgi:L-fucose isomerase-like protein
MLNDDGLPAICQSNINAAISFYILSLLSEDPPFFGDIGYVDKMTGVAHLINCGSLPGRLASSSGEIELNNQYEYMGAGRGVCTFFCCKPGPMTFGTLGRINGEYIMHVSKGEAFSEPAEKLLSVRTWAQGFVKLHDDPKKFFHNLRSNHSVAAYGNFSDELIELCNLLNIPVV